MIGTINPALTSHQTRADAPTPAQTSALAKTVNTTGNTSASLNSTLPPLKSFLWGSPNSGHHLSGSSISVAKSESDLAVPSTGRPGYERPTLDDPYKAAEQRHKAPTPLERSHSDPERFSGVSTADASPSNRHERSLFPANMLLNPDVGSIAIECLHSKISYLIENGSTFQPGQVGTDLYISNMAPISVIDSLEMESLRKKVLNLIESGRVFQLGQLPKEHPLTKRAIDCYFETRKLAKIYENSQFFSLSEKKQQLTQLLNRALPEGTDQFTYTLKNLAVNKSLESIKNA